MKKSKVVLMVVIALTVAVTGCGEKNNGRVENQKEVTVDKKKTSKTKEQSKETVAEVKEQKNLTKDEMVATQQTASLDSDTNSSSNGNTAGNSGSDSNAESHSSGNSAGGANVNTNTNAESNNSPTVVQEHIHSWVHHDVTGHYESVVIQAAFDEEVPIYESAARSICNQCGADITECCDEHMEVGMLAGTCWAWHIEYIQIQTGTKIIHHDAVTEQRWVQESPAYDTCSGCGAIK